MNRSKRHDYELIIVGGGPAGIATALFLQRHAPRVAERSIVLEKARYPREKYCAGAIGGRALRSLERIGVELDVPAAPIHAASIKLPHRSLMVREDDLGIVIRRIEWDHALARAAMRRGIEVRDGAAVHQVDVSDRGVQVQLEGGETLAARAVVGADGVGGIVRRTTGFPKGRLRAQVVELDTEPVTGDPPQEAFHFDLSARDLDGYVWDFPTPVDGRLMWCRGVYAITTRRTDAIRARLGDYLATKGLDVRRYRLKQFAERGFEPDAPIAKPRVLLVGEAAGIDIATGEGIAQAIEYAELAAPFLARAFERDDLSFAGWRERVLRSRAGLRLLVRWMSYRSFHGPERVAAERLFGAGPDLSRLAARDLAGKPLGGAALARTVAQIAGPATRYAPRLAAYTAKGWPATSL